jgi:hypothetical protein
VYAINGRPEEALQIFHEYVEKFPEPELFTHALLACSHGGKVEEAKKIYCDIGGILPKDDPKKNEVHHHPKFGNFILDLQRVHGRRSMSRRPAH